MINEVLWNAFLRLCLRRSLRLHLAVWMGDKDIQRKNSVFPQTQNAPCEVSSVKDFANGIRQKVFLEISANTLMRF